MTWFCPIVHHGPARRPFSIYDGSQDPTPPLLPVTPPISIISGTPDFLSPVSSRPASYSMPYDDDDDDDDGDEEEEQQEKEETRMRRRTWSEGGWGSGGENRLGLSWGSGGENRLGLSEYLEKEGGLMSRSRRRKGGKGKMKKARSWDEMGARRRERGGDDEEERRGEGGGEEEKRVTVLTSENGNYGFLRCKTSFFLFMCTFVYRIVPNLRPPPNHCPPPIFSVEPAIIFLFFHCFIN